MDDFLLSFFYPMMLVLAEILVKEIIKLTYCATSNRLCENL